MQNLKMKTFQCFNSSYESPASETFRAYSIFFPFNRTHKISVWKCRYITYTKFHPSRILVVTTIACAHPAFMHIKRTLSSGIYFSLSRRIVCKTFQISTNSFVAKKRDPKYINDMWEKGWSWWVTFFHSKKNHLFLVFQL